MPLRSFLPSPYRCAQWAIDGCIAALVCWLAFWLRFEGQVDPSHENLAFVLPALAIPGRLLTQAGFGLYQQVWRLFGLRDTLILTYAVSFYSLGLLTLTRLIIPRVWTGFTGLSLGVAALDWSLCIMAMTAARYARRRQSLLRGGVVPSARSPKRVLVLGAGAAGAQVVREASHANHPLQVVGFLDDDVSKQGRRVEGIRILGPLTSLRRWAVELGVTEAIVAMPSASAPLLRTLVEQVEDTGVQLRILPREAAVLCDRTLLPQARAIQIADILGRSEVCLNLAQVLDSRFPSAAKQVQDQTVLVTGAGGTIGGEICNQLATLQPRRIILLGRGENSIFLRERELRQRFPNLQTVPVIADVRHSQRMTQVMVTYRPVLVFHAAAHKHVPLMEANPTEALENNALATAQLAALCHHQGVDTFVLISTDKAVDSNNFMGLSKRLAELLIKAQSGQSDTRFLAVRFGNVLGSRGSVVPIFQEQIAQGGPVTVTDARMTRYFMTVPEAAQLVIQSIAVGESGQTLILDMGEPVKILELAEQMVRLAGCRPYQDIPIQMTGLRPGEKLHEALLCASEQAVPTVHPKLTVVVDQIPDFGVGLEVRSEIAEAVKSAESREELWRDCQAWVHTLSQASQVSGEVDPIVWTDI
jgi:FlaA1/EpsC-like NDP-sugar epimerase